MNTPAAKRTKGWIDYNAVQVARRNAAKEDARRRREAHAKLDGGAAEIAAYLARRGDVPHN